MDKKDEEILQILEDDGRASFTSIADKVDVSEGTVRNRVQKMREQDVIRNFTVERGNEGSSAVVMVKLETGRDIEAVLEKFPKGIRVMEVAGEYDVILEVQKPSNKEINDLLDGIRGIEGVESTETFMVLNERTR